MVHIFAIVLLCIICYFLVRFSTTKKQKKSLVLFGLGLFVLYLLSIVILELFR